MILWPGVVGMMLWLVVVGEFWRGVMEIMLWHGVVGELWPDVVGELWRGVAGELWRGVMEMMLWLGVVGKLWHGVVGEFVGISWSDVTGKLYPGIVWKLWSGIVWFLWLNIIPIVNGESVRWYPVQVSSTKLSLASPQTLDLANEIICAMKATHTTWSTLFTYHDTTCYLYGVNIYSESDDSLLSDTVTCWTRLSGNENLHAVTGGGKQYILRVDATRLTGESGTGEWDVFIVDTESNNYRVTITGYNSVSSTLGDDLTYNSGIFFSTIDVDNSGGCVTQRGGGGWWYSGCSWAHPTAPHGNTDGSSSVLSWYYFTPTTSGWVGLKQLKMMIRPK
ncbi:ficolin-1-like 4 [Homarus americanus]|uniref:Ficolin-1-like 4 n=1 Tax=Homarus americanus TaxID=6706 RepID=A0A8J5JHZ8_HOMAM|nr:ficolin-1-like 4 [Homarus americanus]